MIAHDGEEIIVYLVCHLIILILRCLLGISLFLTACLVDGWFGKAAIQEFLLQSYGMRQLGAIPHNVVHLLLKSDIVFKILLQSGKPAG